MAKRIEVEIRSLLSDGDFNRLLSFFEANAQFLGDDGQETHYRSGPSDLRIQKSEKGSKIWLKKGEMHDDRREEVEVWSSQDSFDSISDLFSALGHSVTIKWLRTRKTFLWKDCTVTLDDTKGYGRIIELERLVPEEEAQDALDALQLLAKELGITPTPKEDFSKKFNEYKEDWKTLIKN
ncbi:MAG TPA: CYTH domain-containing protein [Candidatus Nanoarchaeia archaeon]|nr:CYTH domain-containing protein [Candidatus Nanoarchaeia archaeon]